MEGTEVTLITRYGRLEVKKQEPHIILVLLDKDGNPVLKYAYIPLIHCSSS